MLLSVLTDSSFLPVYGEVKILVGSLIKIKLIIESSCQVATHRRTQVPVTTIGTATTRRTQKKTQRQASSSL